jgi:hypothetical protein
MVHVQDGSSGGCQELKMTKPDRNATPSPSPSPSPPVTAATTTTSLEQPSMSENVRILATEDHTVSTEDYDHDEDEDDYEYDNDDNDDDDDDDQEMPLLNYSRIFSAGLPRKPSTGSQVDNNSNNSNNNNKKKKTDCSSASLYFEPSCTCSELTVIRVEPEDMSPNVGSTATATTTITTTTSSTSSSMSTPLLFPIPQQTQTAAAGATSLVASSISSTPSSSSTLSSTLQQQQQLLTSDLWQQPHLIMACGWAAKKNSITLTNVQPNNNNGANGLPVVILGGSHVVTSTSGTSTDIMALTGGTNSSSGTTIVSSSTTTTSAAAIELSIREIPSTYSVVDMSFDSSGTILGAIDDGGSCAIWEMKYTATLQPNRLLSPTTITTTITSTPTPSIPTRNNATAANSNANQGTNNMFSNWMSALTGMPPTTTTTSSSSYPQSHQQDASAPVNRSNNITSTPAAVDGMRATLTAQLLSQPSRINYPVNWGSPTCMVLDPSFKRKREKSILVGFTNGRLVLTKRGTFFQRRNDTVLYQAGIHAAAKDTNQSYRGIETVVWRGSLVAWADANGIKLLDMEHLTRIAHIDRPAGARPSLYPSVADLRPTLFFETSRHLLVAWGDCIMQLQIDEHVVVASSASSGAAGASDGPNHPPPPSSSSSSEVTTKRRTVQCTMAWELDCVACDAVPLDANHIAVLGFVPTMEEEEEQEEENHDNDNGSHNHKNNNREDLNDPATNHLKNDVELQFVSRSNGSLSYCDALPLLRKSPSCYARPDSALPFRLLSTFALSRMEDSEESKVWQSRTTTTTTTTTGMLGNEMGLVEMEMDSDWNQNYLFPTDATNSRRRRLEYRDPHLQWNLTLTTGNNGTIKDVVVGPENTTTTSSDLGLTGHDNSNNNNNNTDTDSVDSDDYECLLRPIDTFEAWQGLNFEQKAPAPTMIVCSGSDAVLAQVSTIDDAITNALVRKKCALALKLALRHRRQMRRHSLDDLVSKYLEAVLRIPNMTVTTNRKESKRALSSTLSLRRMQLAVKAMPILFGNKIPLWQQWTKELERIPGALFLLRNYLPVRGTIGVAFFLREKWNTLGLLFIVTILTRFTI